MTFTLRQLKLSLLVIALTAALPAVAYYPSIWSYGRQAAKLVSSRWGSKVALYFVIAEDLRSDIFTILAACRTASGSYVDNYECANSVTASMMAFGLSVATYQTTGTWSKRSTDLADQVLGRLPDTIKITDIQILGSPLLSNSSSTSLHRRQDSADTPISVNYTGGLPLTFVMHHPVTNSSEHIPMFIATDGTKVTINHLHMIDDQPSQDNETVSRRSGVNGYTHIGVGGLKMQANSDPVAYWDDVMNWLSASENDDGSPLYDIVQWEKTSPMLGVASVNPIYDYYGKTYDAQFIMEGETVAFSSDWEVGWNYCYGSYPTNC